MMCLGLGTDTMLRHGCEDAQAHRAGALITVLGGLRAKAKGGAMSATSRPSRSVASTSSKPPSRSPFGHRNNSGGSFARS